MKTPSLAFDIPQKTIEKIGLKESIIFFALLKINEQQEIEPNEKLYFACSVAFLQKETSFTKSQQTRLIDKLKGFGLIETQLAGIPAKRFIHVNPAYQSIIDSLYVKGNRAKDKNTAPKRNFFN